MNVFHYNEAAYYLNSAASSRRDLDARLSSEEPDMVPSQEQIETWLGDIRLDLGFAQAHALLATADNS